MEVFAKKRLFDKENWLTRTWNTARSWFRYTFNKNHVELAKAAFNGRPYDYGYLFDLEYYKIKEIMEYHIRANRFVGVEYAIRDMRICLSLIEIFTGRRNLFHFDGDIVFKEIDKDTLDKLGETEPLYEMTETDDFEYHCDVNVNLKNLHRFVDDEELYDFYNSHPHEFYELKARCLYHKIRLEKELEWWD